MSCDCGGGLNQILQLDVPGSDQTDGLILDVSGLVGEKTIEISGEYSGSYTILASNDGQGFCPVLSFDAGSGAQAFKQTSPFIVKFLKVRRAARNSSQISISVGAQAALNCSGSGSAGANQFIALATIPAGSGAGPLDVLDLWSIVPPTGLDSGWCAICSGDFVGTISLEGSLDGVKFSPLGVIPQTQPRAAGTQGALLGFSISPVRNTLSPFPVLAPLLTSETVRYVRPRIISGTSARGPVQITIGGRKNCPGTSGGLGTTLYGLVVASTSGPASCPFPGALVGYKVVFVIDPTFVDPNPTSHFEPTISVANSIQQLAGAFPGAVFDVPILLAAA